MPSTKTNSEPDPATDNDDSNLSTHKRLDSRDLEGVGAQFRRASKADSIARPADLDLDSDEEEFQVHQHSTGDQADGTQRARSEGGSSSAARVGHHQYSKEDVALLIFHRDKGHNAEGQGATPSETSRRSTRDASPKMTEADDHAATHVFRESSRPQTPPSATTTDDEYSGLAGDPSSSPWTAFRCN